MSMKESPQYNYILCGDFNLPNVDWSNSEPKIKTGSPKSEREILNYLKLIMNEHFLCQIVKEPTHILGNTLDLIFTNNIDIIHELNIFKPKLRSYTDHFFIEIATNLKKPVPQIPVDVSSSSDSIFNTLNFQSEEVEWNNIKIELNNIDWEDELSILQPEQKVEKILSISYDIAKKYVPQKKTFQKRHMIPRDRRLLMKRKTRINKRLLKSNSQSIKDKLQSELVNIEKLLQKSRKKAKYYAEQKAINSIKKNSKYFYAYAKKLSTIKTGLGPLKNEQGEFIYDNVKMAEMLSSQFSSVFTKTTDQPLNKEEIFPTTQNYDLEDLVLNEETFIEALSELSPQAAAGPDGMPAILLLKCKEEYATALKILWRNAFDKGVTPSSLKQPVVVPIFKGGEKANPSSYRPISLTSHIIKVFEKVVRKAIVNHLENKSLFNKNQHGFRHGHSCLSELLAHYEQIMTEISDKNGVDTIYLDFAKAFDKVDFLTLLKKLEKIGIGGKIGRWIYSFLYERQQIVVVNGARSQPTKVLSGVPQGSVLGPILFLIMITDIDTDIKDSVVRSFADDTRVSKSIATINNGTLLQNDLNLIYDWADRNKMKFNSNKFELLRYRIKGNNIQDCTSYTTDSGEQIEEKNLVKDLGVLISNDCSFSKHIDKVAKSMRNMSSWILRTFETRDKLTLLTVWKTLVLPIHDYCSQLWSPVLIKEKNSWKIFNGISFEKSKVLNQKHILSYSTN